MCAGEDAGQDGGEARGPGPGQPAQPVCARPQCCWQVQHPWTGLCTVHAAYNMCWVGPKLATFPFNVECIV